MVALAPFDSPARRFDISSIDRVAEHIADTLVRKLAALRLGIERVLFDEARHIGLRLKLARDVALERFPDDRCLRLMWHEHPPVEARHPAILIAGGRGEDGEAVRNARLHPVERLLAVVDAVIVSEGDSDVFHQPRRRTLVEHARGRLQDRTKLRYRAPQIGMEVEVARETIEVVEHNSEARRFAFLDEGKHRAQAGTPALAAGHFIPEDLGDAVTHPRAVIAQPRFLRSEAVAFALLLLTRHTAVDQRCNALCIDGWKGEFHAGLFAVSGFSVI
nr:hypothetical protein [Methylobacterium crusticola]